MGCCHVSLQLVLHNDLVHNLDLLAQVKVTTSIGTPAWSQLGHILVVVPGKAPLVIAPGGSSGEDLLDGLLHLRWQPKMAVSVVAQLLDAPAGIVGVGELGSALYVFCCNWFTSPTVCITVALILALAVELSFFWGVVKVVDIIVALNINIWLA